MSDDQEKSFVPDPKATGILTDPVAEVTCAKCGCEIDVGELEPFVRVECPDCGNIEIVPARLGPFLLLDLIGTGGMGGVYYAKDPTLGRFVAVKVMLQALGDDQKFVENFKREAQAAARLNHPNIVQIYSFGQEKGQPYIVMELVSGEGLDKQMENGRQLSQQLAMKVGLDIAEGLMAADEAGLIHGDIKPENILFDDKRNAKLVDFGIASFAKQGPNEGSIWGTPYYIAPEKVKRQKVDARSDIYSLGATIYHALAGKPPFDGQTPIQVVKARLERPAKALSEVRPNIDRQVERIVMRMLQAEPSMRYPTYASLVSDLKRVVKTLSGNRITGSGGTKTGRIYIPKRHAETPMAEVPDVKITNRQERPAGGSKIVIARKKTIIAQGNSVLTDFKARATGAPAPVEAAAPPRKKKKKSKAGKWAFAILLVVGSLGGGIGFLVHRDNQKVQFRRDLQLLGQRIETVSNRNEEVQGLLGQVTTAGSRAGELRVKVTNAVFIVLGEAYDWPPPEKPADAPKTPKVDVPKEAPKAEAPKPAPAEVVASDDAPPGEMSREALDRLRRQREPAEAPKAEAPKETPKEAPKEAPKESAPEPAKEPEKEVEDPKSIKTPAKRTLKRVEDIRTRMTEGAGLGAKAIAARDEAYRAYAGAVDRLKPPDAARTRAAIPVVEARLKTLDECKEAANELKQAVDGLMVDAEKQFKAVDEMRADHVARLEEAKRQKEEAERLEKAAAEQKIKDEQYQALAAKEREAVTAAKADVMLMVKQFKYKEAVARLKEQFAAFETREGKAAGGLLTDQYQKLAELKTFLIERMNEDPYGFGFGFGPSARDILGADETNIKVRDRAVPWSDVSSAQMLKLCKHYLNENRKTKIKDQAEQSVGAAIYCVENGGGTDAAKRMAAEYARKAVELRDYLAEEVKRLLPVEVRDLM